MSKWIKTQTGQIINADKIVNFFWDANMSATSDYRYELKIKVYCDNQTLTIAKCQSENEKECIEDILESFLCSNANMLEISKDLKMSRIVKAR